MGLQHKVCLTNPLPSLSEWFTRQPHLNSNRISHFAYDVPYLRELHGKYLLISLNHYSR